MNKDTQAQITYFDFLLQSSIQYYQENLDKKLLYIFELYIKTRIADDYTVIENIDVNNPVLNETFQDDMLKSLNNNLKNNIKKYTIFYLLEYILLIMDALTNNQEWKKKSEEYIKIDQTMGNLAIELLNPTYIKDITKNFTTFPKGFPILSKKVSTPKDIYSPNRSPGSTPPSTSSPIFVGVGGGDEVSSDVQVGGNMHAPFKDILEKIAEIKHDFGHERGCIKELINGIRGSSHIKNILNLTNEPLEFAASALHINQLVQPTAKKNISIEKILNSSDLELLMFNTFFTIFDLNASSSRGAIPTNDARALYLQKFIFMSSKGSLGTNQYSMQVYGDIKETALQVNFNELLSTYLNASGVTSYILDASIANLDTGDLRTYLDTTKINPINIKNIPATLWDRARSVAPDKQSIEMSSFIGEYITGECNTLLEDARRQFLRSKYSIKYIGPGRIEIIFCESKNTLLLTEGFSVNQLSIALYYFIRGEPLDSAKLKKEFARIPEEDIGPIINLISYIDTYIPDRNTRIQILFDLKKIGDWNQVMWIKNHQDHLFWTGDRLCALYSILNDNKTLFGGKIFDRLPLVLGYYRGSSPLTVACIKRDFEFLYSLFINKDGSNTFFNEDRSLKEPDVLFGRDGRIPTYEWMGSSKIHQQTVAKLFLVEGSLRQYYNELLEFILGHADTEVLDNDYLNERFTFIKNFFTLISDIKKINNITPRDIWTEIKRFKNEFIVNYAMENAFKYARLAPNQITKLHSFIRDNSSDFKTVISGQFPRGRTAHKIISKFEKWDPRGNINEIIRAIIDGFTIDRNTPELFSSIFDLMFNNMDIHHIFVELPNMYASIMRQSEIIVGSYIDGRDTLGPLVAEMTRNMILESSGDYRPSDQAEDYDDSLGTEFGFNHDRRGTKINPDDILHEVNNLNDALSELYIHIESTIRIDKVSRKVQSELENLERSMRRVDTFSQLIHKLVS